MNPTQLRTAGAWRNLDVALLVIATLMVSSSRSRAAAKSAKLPPTIHGGQLNDLKAFTARSYQFGVIRTFDSVAVR